MTRQSRIFSFALSLLCAFSGAGRAAAAAAPSPAAQYIDAASGVDWPGFGRSYGEDHYSPLTQIDRHTVGRLGLAWYIDLPPGNAATEPVEVGGVLYYANGLSIVHAVDAVTGRQLWQYDPHSARNAGPGLRYSWGPHGLCWWNGKVYIGTADGRLIALDGTTGKLIWSVQHTVKGGGQFITGAPRAFAGKIIVGQGGGDFTFSRGYATAYDAETGKQLWRFYTVPGDPAKGFENKAMAMAAKSWSGQWWKWGGGGMPWNAFAYDQADNLILFGVGNGYPWNVEIRSPGGDNLFLCSIVAVDADTGEYRWHYQLNAGDSWDYDSTMDIELADLKIDGKIHHVAMQAPKNGYFYVIDRTNGKLLSAGQIAEKLTWAQGIDMKTGRPIEVPGIHYQNDKTFEMWPSARGAHSWMPMAFSPQTGLAYIPRISQGMSFDSKGVSVRNLHLLGANITDPKPDPLNDTSALIAWNPVTQKLAWKVPTLGGWNGGVLATGGDLVFEGQLNGRLSAYEARHGRELWHFAGQDAMLAAPISYMVGAKQYVTIVIGMAGTASIEPQSQGGQRFDYRTQKRRVLTFALGGTASLPPAPPPTAITAAADPAYKPDPVLAAEGAGKFGFNCGICHGPGVVSGGGAPDLRSSDVPPQAEIFRSVVRDGMLLDDGMPRFNEMTDHDLAAIRQYIRSRAAELRAGQK